MQAFQQFIQAQQFVAVSTRSAYFYSDPAVSSKSTVIFFASLFNTQSYEPYVFVVRKDDEQTWSDIHLITRDSLPTLLASFFIPIPQSFPTSPLLDKTLLDKPESRRKAHEHFGLPRAHLEATYRHFVDGCLGHRIKISVSLFEFLSTTKFDTSFTIFENALKTALNRARSNPQDVITAIIFRQIEICIYRKKFGPNNLEILEMTINEKKDEIGMEKGKMKRVSSCPAIIRRKPRPKFNRISQEQWKKEANRMNNVITGFWKQKNSRSTRVSHTVTDNIHLRNSSKNETNKVISTTTYAVTDSSHTENELISPIPHSPPAISERHKLQSEPQKDSSIREPPPKRPPLCDNVPERRLLMGEVPMQKEEIEEGSQKYSQKPTEVNVADNRAEYETQGVVMDSQQQEAQQNLAHPQNEPHQSTDLDAPIVEIPAPAKRDDSTQATVFKQIPSLRPNPNAVQQSQTPTQKSPHMSPSLSSLHFTPHNSPSLQDSLHEQQTGLKPATPVVSAPLLPSPPPNRLSINKLSLTRPSGKEDDSLDRITDEKSSIKGTSDGSRRLYFGLDEIRQQSTSQSSSSPRPPHTPRSTHSQVSFVTRHSPPAIQTLPFNTLSPTPSHNASDSASRQLSPRAATNPLSAVFPPLPSPPKENDDLQANRLCVSPGSTSSQADMGNINSQITSTVPASSHVSTSPQPHSETGSVSESASVPSNREVIRVYQTMNLLQLQIQHYTDMFSMNLVHPLLIPQPTIQLPALPSFQTPSLYVHHLSPNITTQNSLQNSHLTQHHTFGNVDLGSYVHSKADAPIFYQPTSVVASFADNRHFVQHVPQPTIQTQLPSHPQPPFQSQPPSTQIPSQPQSQPSTHSFSLDSARTLPFVPTSHQSNHQATHNQNHVVSEQTNEQINKQERSAHRDVEEATGGEQKEEVIHQLPLLPYPPKIEKIEEMKERLDGEEGGLMEEKEMTKQMLRGDETLVEAEQKKEETRKEEEKITSVENEKKEGAGKEEAKGTTKDGSVKREDEKEGKEKNRKESDQTPQPTGSPTPSQQSERRRRKKRRKDEHLEDSLRGNVGNGSGTGNGSGGAKEEEKKSERDGKSGKTGQTHPTGRRDAMKTEWSPVPTSGSPQLPFPAPSVTIPLLTNTPHSTGVVGSGSAGVGEGGSTAPTRSSSSTSIQSSQGMTHTQQQTVPPTAGNLVPPPSGTPSVGANSGEEGGRGTTRRNSKNSKRRTGREEDGKLEAEKQDNARQGGEEGSHVQAHNSHSYTPAPTRIKFKIRLDRRGGERRERNENIEDREKSLSLLPPLSNEWYYYSILHEQLLSPDFQTEREASLMKQRETVYQKSDLNYQLYSLRRQFLSFKESTTEEKTKIIDHLRTDILHLNYYHPKKNITTWEERSTVTTADTYDTELDETPFQIDALKKLVKESHIYLPQASPEFIFHHLNFWKASSTASIVTGIPHCTHPQFLDYVKKHYSDHYAQSIQCAISKDQLEKLLSSSTEFSEYTSLVHNYLARITPDPSLITPENELPLLNQYYETIWDVADGLTSKQNQSKASLMKATLDYEWRTKNPNRKHLTTFLSLPYVSTHSTTTPGLFSRSSGASPNQDLVNAATLYNKTDDVLSTNALIEEYLNYYFAPPPPPTLRVIHPGSSSPPITAIRSHDVTIPTTPASFSTFSKYLENGFVRKIQLEALAMTDRLKNEKGKPIEIKPHEQSIISNIRDVVELKFSSQNKPRFNSTDEFELQVRVKNVERMEIRVFDINTLRFYQKNDEELALSIDLDGLSATYSHTILFPPATFPPILRHEELLQIEGLKNRNGVFIVEISGGGQSSRAMLRKGELRVMSRLTANGLAVCVFDDTGRRVKKEEVCLWIDGHPHAGKQEIRGTNEEEKAKNAELLKTELDPEEFLIPFAFRTQTKTVIVSHQPPAALIQQTTPPSQSEGPESANSGRPRPPPPITSAPSPVLPPPPFACRTTLKIPSENYRFECPIFVNREELLQFRTAHLLLRPSLWLTADDQTTLPDVSISLSVLDSFTVTATQVTGQGVVVKKTWDSLKLVDSDLLNLELMICEDLVSLDVSVDCSLRVVSNLNRIKSFNIQSNFSINAICNTQSIVGCAVRRGKRGYELHVHGRAGEPINQCKILAYFAYDAFNLNSTTQTLETDHQGLVYLGELDKVNHFTVKIKDGMKEMETTFMGGRWSDGEFCDFRPMTRSFVLAEGEGKTIPLNVNEDEAELVFLQSTTSDGKPISDVTKLIKVKTGCVILPKTLPPGDYELFEWKRGTSTKISVIEKSVDSEANPNARLVVGRRRVGEVRSSSVGIGEVTVEENGDVSVSLVNASPSTRVHAFCSTYEPVFHADRLLEFSNERNQGVYGDTVRTWEKRDNQYESGRAIGSEHQYILDRKGKDKCGNTLPAPSILAFPTVNEDTKRKDPPPKGGAAFTSRSQAYGGGSNWSSSAKKIDRTVENLLKQTEDRNVLDYLTTVPVVKTNLKVGGEGQTEQETKLVVVKGNEIKDHSVCVIVVTDTNTTLSRRVHLIPSETDKERRDRKEHEKTETEGVIPINPPLKLLEMRLMNPFNSKSHFSEISVGSAIIPQALIQPQPADQTLAEWRVGQKPYFLSAVPSLRIDNLGTAQFEVFSSVSALFHLLSSIATGVGGWRSSEEMQSFTLFKDLLGKVGDFSDSEKIKRYSQLTCTETDIMFFFHFPALFEKELLLGLSSKKEKRVVDQYILCRIREQQYLLRKQSGKSESEEEKKKSKIDLDRAEKQVRFWIDPSHFERLNALEQIFVVDAFVTILQLGGDESKREERKQEAQSIAQAFLRTINHKVTSLVRDKERDARVFDIALRAGQGLPEPEPEPEVAIEEEEMARAEDEEIPEADIPSNGRFTKSRAAPPPAPPPPPMEAPATFAAPPPPPPPPGAAPRAFMAMDEMKRGVALSHGPMKKMMVHGAVSHRLSGPVQDAKFIQVDKTKEYRESEWYKRKGEAEIQQAIPWNRFWKDFAFFLLEDAAEGEDRNTTGRKKGLGNVPFVSPNILDCYSSCAEAVCAIGVSGVGWDNDKQLRVDFQMDEGSDGGNRRGVVDGAVPGLTFVKEMNEITADEAKSQVQSSRLGIVVQELLVDPLDSECRNEDGETVKKSVPHDAVLKGKMYKCETIITNTTSASMDVQVLVQIPSGSMPGDSRFYTKTMHHHIGMHSTLFINYSFYFPSAGIFSHYPAQVSRKGKVIGVGNGLAWKEQGQKEKVVRVLERPLIKPDTDQTPKTESWLDISQGDDEDKLINFLENENIFKSEVNLQDVCWRCGEKKSFERILDALVKRGVYNNAVWSYSLRHYGPVSAIREYITKNQVSWVPLDVPFKSELFTNDPVRAQKVNLYEYRPLINPRTFWQKNEKTIPNQSLETQYKNILIFLAHGGRLNREIEKQEQKKSGKKVKTCPSVRILTNDDKIILTYYLILQERLDEACDMFDSINDSEATVGEPDLEMVLQKDYLEGFLEFNKSDPEKWKDGERLPKSRRIVAKHQNVSVGRWKDMFSEMKRQLEEVDRLYGTDQPEPEKKEEEPQSQAKDVLIDEEAAREDKRQKMLLQSQKRAPSLNVEVQRESFSLLIKQTNGTEPKVKVSCFEVDLEMLFTLRPFIKDSGEKVGIVKPSIVLWGELGGEGDAFKTEVQIPLPDHFHNRNCIFSVDYCGLTRSATLFDHTLSISMYERVGRLNVKAKETSLPLPSCYVKVYGRRGTQEPKFLKDGFTDLTGSFDYASVSMEDGSGSVGGQKLSILVVSQENGCDVVEVQAPGE
ncbi:putative Actin-binding protein [Blattamonas nauphoetae]|uniref:Actin-binding protein n=1 Tax=Blattamonas nauphoetae TaxID=2049346 RepID=A0ABQ9XMC8_9EUKA|nr:putative Actin-binding protein [Blattamonas nauphoetae]